jgi:hypothetical protein
MYMTHNEFPKENKLYEHALHSYSKGYGCKTKIGIKEFDTAVEAVDYWMSA